MGEIPQGQADNAGQVIVQPAANVPEEQTWQYWKNKHDGVKGSWQQEKDRADRLAIDLSKVNIEKEGNILNLTSERDQFKKQAEDALKSAKEWEGKHGLSSAQLDVTRLLTSADYADVAPLYGGEAAVAVLAAMTPEARKATLDEAKTNADKLFSLRKQQSAEGSLPTTPVNPPPPGTQTGEVTIADAKTAVQVALSSKGQNSPEYHKAANAYESLLIAEGRKTVPKFPSLAVPTK